MTEAIERITPPGTMTPIGPYNHISKGGGLVVIGGVAGVDPSTGDLSGPDVTSQTRQILSAFEQMLKAAGSDVSRVLRVTVYLKDMADFAEMNAAYAEVLGPDYPSRTAVSVVDLPKPGARLTMDLIALAGE